MRTKTVRILNIVAGILLIAVALLIYRFRVPLIFQPMVNFLARLFLDDTKKTEPGTIYHRTIIPWK